MDCNKKDCIHYKVCEEWKLLGNDNYINDSYGNCEYYVPTVEQSQGEWIAREDMDYLDENKVVHKHFECNKCGFIHDFIDGHTSQYNFCPNCGADMRKGGAV